MEKIDPIVAKETLLYINKLEERFIYKIEIGCPFKMPEGEYCCPYQIAPEAKNNIKKSHGQTSLQALQIAFEQLNVIFLLLRERGRFYYTSDISEDISQKVEIDSDFILPRKIDL